MTRDQSARDQAISAVISTGLAGIAAWVAVIASHGDRLYFGAACAFTACCLVDAVALLAGRRK